MFRLLKRRISHLTQFRVSRRIAFIATAFIIIFVGVYLADLFAERREERFPQERQALISDPGLLTSRKNTRMHQLSSIDSIAASCRSVLMSA
jgi:hypothetical protein